MKRNVMIIFAVAILAGLAVFQNHNRSEAALAGSDVEKPKLGFAAPAFELPDLEDMVLRFGGARDKLLLLNFWASWCGPCELEAPDLQELHEQWGDQIEIVGVNATFYDRERYAREFVGQFGLTFPIVMDRDGKVTELYKVSSFPTNLLVDRNGIVRERVSVISKKEWERLFKKWAAQ